MTRSDFRIDFAAMKKIDRNWSQNLYWHVSDQISFMPWPNTSAKLRQAFKIAPEGIVRFYLTGTIEGPVENGGLGQYFASRRFTWLHELAKKTISDFGCQDVVEILDEAERYLKQNADHLRNGMPWDEWVKIMGVVPMNKALNNIHGRFMRAYANLHNAKELYLRENRNEFG